MAALFPHRARRAAADSGYLTADEAAAYVGFRSTNALRMAVSRKQLAPTARRGRTLLFTRADLDRQVLAGTISVRPRPSPSHDAEETLIVECDLAAIDTARTHWPFLRDRRVDAYSDLTKRFIDDE